MKPEADPIVIELIRRRVERGHTQETVAMALKVTQPTVARWESGQRLMLVSHLYAYAALVGASVALIPAVGDE